MPSSFDPEPSATVLAKVKGYPPWPAMVLDEAILPEHILKKRPKTKSKKSNTRAVPVRFFSDDTYIWINTNDVKPLEKEAIDAHFAASNSKRRKDNLLERAYALARDPPQMDVFVKWGSNPPSAEEIAAQEELEKAAEEEYEDDEEEEEEEEELDDEPPARKKAKVTMKLEGYDSDWGDELNEYDYEIGDYIFDTKKEQDEVFSTINAEDVQKRHSYYHQEVQELSNELIPLLTSESQEIDAKKAVQLVGKVGKLVKESPKSVIHRSPLLRAMILSARRPVEELNPSLKKAVMKVLGEIGIEIVPNEKKEEEKEEKEEEKEEEKKEDIKEEKSDEKVEGKDEQVENQVNGAI